MIEDEARISLGLHYFENDPVFDAISLALLIMKNFIIGSLFVIVVITSLNIRILFDKVKILEEKVQVLETTAGK